MLALRLALPLPLLLWSLHAYALSNDSLTLHPGATYGEAKTWHEQFMGNNPTKAQRLEAMRSLILASPVRSRGLQQIYHNFDGRYSIDPAISGVEGSVLKQLSASRQQAKGYRREVLYAIAYHNNPKFSLDGMNRPLKRPWGNTDADLDITHKPTQLSGRIEVKDYSQKSQQTNLPKLKVQIDKMALEGKKTGQLQFWMNSRTVIPEIYQYGEKAGVYVAGNVKTGKTIAQGSISIAEAMDQQEKHFFRSDRNRLLTGSSELVLGIWKLHGSIPKALADIKIIANTDNPSSPEWLRLGESSSSVISGSAMLVSGGALTSARFANESIRPKLYGVGRGGGYVGLAALGLEEAFLVSRYVKGDVLSQEFWTGQWVMGATGTGALAGGGVAWLLAKFPASALAGSSVGSYIGKEIGERTAEMYYDYKFGELDRAFGRWVYAKYGI